MSGIELRERSMKIPKSSTPKKIKANQQNAQDSTGPKTPAGKKNSRANSYDHGFFAKIVPMSGDEEHALETLKAKIAKKWPINTPFQETALDLVAYCHRRVKAGIELENQRLDTFLKASSAEVTAPEGQGLPEMLRWYGASQQELSTGIRFLDHLAADIQQHGRVGDQWKQQIIDCFGQQFLADLSQWSCSTDLETLKLARTLRAHAENLNMPLAEDTAENGGAMAVKDPNQCLEMMLKLISVQRQALQSAKRMIEDGLFRSVQSQATEFNPRYFTAAMRDLHRAVDWLVYLN
jgi:hypothetical protein